MRANAYSDVNEHLYVYVYLGMSWSNSSPEAEHVVHSKYLT